MRVAIITLACSLAAGCAPPPPPEPPRGPPAPPVTAAPIASSAPSSASAPAPTVVPAEDVLDPPDPDFTECAAPRPRANGLIPNESLPRYFRFDDVPSPRVADAADCVKALGGKAHPSAVPGSCVADQYPSLFAVDPKQNRIAAITVAWRPTAMLGCLDVRGEALDGASLKVISSRRMGARNTCARQDLDINVFARELARRGFVDAPNLVTRRAEEPAGATAFHASARLAEPLCGYMIFVKRNGARLDVMLVDPANDAGATLGSLPLEYEYPSVLQVVLTPDRKRLAILISATSGGHNEPLIYQRGSFALPPNVKLAAAP